MVPSQRYGLATGGRVNGGSDEDTSGALSPLNSDTDLGTSTDTVVPEAVAFALAFMELIFTAIDRITFSAAFIR